MLSKEEENALNYTLAIGYLILSLQIDEEKQVMKQIDSVFDNAKHRIYLRNLLKEAKKIMEQQNKNGECNIE